MLKKCLKCDIFIRKKYLAKHLAKVHGVENPKAKSIQRQQVESEQKQAVQPKTDSRIILISKRGMRVSKLTPCDSCYSKERIVWRYAESNRGEIYLCGKCKVSIFNRSFDNVDAMDMAYQGGAFETNRRRH